MSDLPHGYTIADIQLMARKAAGSQRGMGADYSDIYHAAWSAIIDALYAAEHPPLYGLVREGVQGIWAMVAERRHTYGVPDKNPYAGNFAMPSFVKFWFAPVAGGPENSVTDRVALRQVWAALSDGDRQVLSAVAVHDGDYHAAAAALGRDYYSFGSRLSVARRRARELWFDQEHPPPRPRKSFNERLDKGSRVQPCGTLAAARRHTRYHEPMCEECRPVSRAYFHRLYEARKARQPRG